MKKLLLFLILANLLNALQGQPPRHIIQLNDKKNTTYSLSRPDQYLSSRAVRRRLQQKISIDSTDLPVDESYVKIIAGIKGITIVNQSKWFNSLIVEANNYDALTEIERLPFVRNVKSVSTYLRKTPVRDEINTRPFPKSKSIRKSVLQIADVMSDSAKYGNNFDQIHLHEGEYLHKHGHRGAGIRIAMLDGGFNSYRTNPVFDSIRSANRIIDEYDFVNNDNSVNEDNVHGANCLSIIASNHPGIMVGSAPDAEYLLYKTEDVFSEYPIEEYYWAIAAERADSAGADIISSSIGYAGFDDPSYNYEYEDRNGNTAIVTIAADFAAGKGIIVVNAAGNSGRAGNDNKYVMCPADGDSVLAVGAINKDGIIADFSSWGPNGAGKIKPDVVSLGWEAVYANTDGAPVNGSGTSYAAPNIAGLAACLWQAYPEYSNMEIIEAITQSADRISAPNDRAGFGIPNFRIASESLRKKREERLQLKLGNAWLMAYPVPFQDRFKVLIKPPATAKAWLKITDANGRMRYIRYLEVKKDEYITIDFDDISGGPAIYYLQYSDGKNTKTIRLAGLK